MESARDLFEHELSSATDAASQIPPALRPIAKKTSDRHLRSMLDEFVSAVGEQGDRLGRVVDLLGSEVSPAPSKPIRGMLDDAKSAAKRASAPEVTDVYVGKVAVDVAQHLEGSYQVLMQLAERSGLTHSTPEIGGLLEPGTKETKRSVHRLRKQVEKLMEQLRPN